ELADPTGVPFGPGERRGQEELHETDRFLRCVHARADADHVGVVVLPGEPRGVLVPGERRADSPHLVRGDLLTVPGAADHDAEAAGIVGDALRGAQHEWRVVVLRVVDERAAVLHLMTLLFEPVGQLVLQFKAGMVGTYIDTHTPSVAAARSGRHAGPE